MSFSDLVKAAKHKYIKRIPKPRGGYRYVYTATHAGGVAKEEHFKAGAAFKLTFNGQEGHFHIVAEEGDTLTIKHDELHGPEHSGVKMTRAELAALLTKEHAPALERAAEKKRARAEKKRARAEKKDTLTLTLTHAGAKLEGALLTGAQLEGANLSNADLRGADLRGADLRDANLKLANLSGANLRGAKLKGANMYSTDLPNADLSGANLEGAKAIDANLTNAELSGVNLSGADLSSANLSDTYFLNVNLSGADISAANLSGVQMASANLSGANLKHADLEGADKDQITRLAEQRENIRLAEQRENIRLAEQRKEEETHAPAQDTEARVKEINQEIDKLKRAPAKNADKIVKLERERAVLIYGPDEPAQDTEARVKEINQEIDKLKRAPAKNADKIVKLERERAVLIYGPDEPAQEKERPNNFETMPPSDDYKREGPLSDKGSAALNQALGEALEKGDLKQAAELRARADRAALHTGAPVVDTLLSDLLSKAETRELPDGTRHLEHTAQLTTAEANALEEAVDKGALVSHKAGEITTYRAATERTGAAKSTSFRLMVKDGRASLVYDDFSATAPQSAEDSTFEPEPARDAAQVESVLSELEQLMKNNPNLLNDPRLKGLIGSLEDTPPKTQGATTPLFITGLDGVQRTQEARFVLMEAGDVIGSHDPLSFAQREDYPKGIQERDYHQNPTEQLKVERNAANLEPAYLLNTNPDATNGPPIVTPEGIALGGNSRTMSLQLAYGRGSKGADKYKAELTRQAAAYGFTEADVKALKAPVLVRVYEPQDNSQRTLSQLVRSMNESKTQGLDARIEGRALASKLSEQTLKTISQALKEAPEGFSLNRVLTRPSKGLTEIISNLMKDGVITQESGPKYLRDDGTMTAAGRELVAQVLVGYVIRDEKTLRNMDYQTAENLSVALGKLAGAGVGPAVKDALESAVTIYDMAIRRDLITARGSIQSRLEGVTHALNEVDAFGKVSVGETDIEGHKDTIRNNPLASAFLQILITNKGSRGIEDSISRFIDLTSQKEQVSMFESAEPMDYTEAARAIVQELAKEHNIDARLFSDIEAERKAREASAGPSLL